MLIKYGKRGTLGAVRHDTGREEIAAGKARNQRMEPGRRGAEGRTAPTNRSSKGWTAWISASERLAKPLGIEGKVVAKSATDMLGSAGREAGSVAHGASSFVTQRQSKCKGAELLYANARVHLRKNRPNQYETLPSAPKIPPPTSGAAVEPRHSHTQTDRGQLSVAYRSGVRSDVGSIEPFI